MKFTSLYPFRMALLVAAAALVPPVAAERYTITDLGALTSDSSSAAVALNNNGAVLCKGSPSNHSFLWRSGTRTDLSAIPPPRGSSVVAVDINKADVVVADYLESTPDPSGSGLTRSFRRVGVWSGSWTQVSDHSYYARPVSQDDYAVTINDLGNVLLRRDNTDQSGTTPSGHLMKRQYDEYSGTVSYMDTDIGNLGVSYTVPKGMNNLNQVVGRSRASVMDGTVTDSAFFWDEAVGWPAMAALPPEGTGFANAISDDGKVVGHYLLGPNRPDGYAATWIDQKCFNLPSLSEAFFSTARAVNSEGTSVGLSGDVPVRWGPTGIELLNDRLPPGSGWTLTDAVDVNDNGQIVGTGTHNGKTRAYLLTPVLRGDADGDGTLTIADVTAVLRASAGLVAKVDVWASDIAPCASTDPTGYGNRRVDLRDAAAILGIVAMQ